MGTSDEKVKVGIFIRRSVNEKFRSLINKKYNKYERGLLSYEAELAFRNWIALHTNAQTNFDVNKPNPTPMAATVFGQVKQYLLSNYYYELIPGQQVTRRHLEEGIMAVRGSDPRTVRKWLKTFHKFGLIKPITSATWELL